MIEIVRFQIMITSIQILIKSIDVVLVIPHTEKIQKFHVKADFKGPDGKISGLHKNELSSAISELPKMKGCLEITVS